MKKIKSNNYNFHKIKKYEFFKSLINFNFGFEKIK